MDARGVCIGMSFCKIERATVQQLCRFVVMGMTTMIVCWGSFFLLLKILDMHYLVSVNLATLAAWGYAFIVNKWVVFRDGSQAVLWQGSQFFVLQAVLLGISNLLMYIMVSLLSCKMFVALFIMTAIVTVCNFAGMKMIVFKSASSELP